MKKVPLVILIWLLFALQTFTFTVKQVKSDPELSLLLETDKSVYRWRENITITVTNIGSETVPWVGRCPVPWDIFTYPENRCVFGECLCYCYFELAPGENVIYTWNQSDYFTIDPVLPGTYEVRDNQAWGLSTFFTIVGNIVVPDDYSTIQAAINAATEGDTIFVRNGTYCENVIVNKTVSLIGESRNTTIADKDGDGDVIYVVADHVVIRGFTITNKTVCSNETPIWKRDSALMNGSLSGIYLYNRENVTLTDLRVEGFLNGIFLNASYNTMIQGCDLIDNAKGIYLEESSTTTIKENAIVANRASAILLRSSSNNMISMNNIIDNGMGISMQFYNSWNNTISENCFRNNGVYAISLYKCSNTTIKMNAIAGYCPYTCWGVRLDHASNNSIYHNSFVHNTIQVVSEGSFNFWENSDINEGNYWSDYEGVDTNGDGLGDSPHTIDENNTDYFPLMRPIFWWNLGDVNYDFTVDISDVMLVRDAYGSTPSDPNWNCHCDIVEPFGLIDLFDVVLMADSYGEEYYGP